MFGTYFSASALSVLFCRCSCRRVTRTCTAGVSVTMVSLACTETGDSVTGWVGSEASAGLAHNTSASAQKPEGRRFKMKLWMGVQGSIIVRCTRCDRRQLVAAWSVHGMRAAPKGAGAEPQDRKSVV